MHYSTEYLLTHLHLQKLSRMKFGIESDWSSFAKIKEAAEERFGVKFETTEKDKLFKLHALITFYIPFWEKNSNPEY